MEEQGLSFQSLHMWPMIIGFVFMGISFLVGSTLKRKFNKYSKTPLQSNLSGKEVAEKMLADHGIYDVKVTCVPGKLTDHYNPMNKTVNLSEAVYNGRNAAATAVSAHECGHAVQHATSYSWLKFRSAMVPLQNASGWIMNIVVMLAIFGGSFLYNTFPTNTVLWVLVGANAVITLFTLVTLPVEFDASNRALAWIDDKGIVTQSEFAMSKDALKWAAMTYVVAALAAITNLLYWVMLLMGSRD